MLKNLRKFITNSWEAIANPKNKARKKGQQIIKEISKKPEVQEVIEELKSIMRGAGEGLESKELNQEELDKENQKKDN